MSGASGLRGPRGPRGEDARRSPAPAPPPDSAARLERASLAGMALGVALLLQPWWPGGVRAGFFVTLGCTLLQIVAAHLPRGRA